MRTLLELLGFVAFIIVCYFAYEKTDLENIKKENQRLQETSALYLDGLFYGVNKGGYTITIGDDSVTVKCKPTKKWGK